MKEKITTICFGLQRCVIYMFYGDITFVLLGLTFMLIVSSVGIVIVNKGVIYEFILVL